MADTEAKEVKDDVVTETPEATEPQLINLLIKSPQGHTINLPANPGDNVQEVKQFLFEGKDICYVTSYAFNHNGQRVNDYEPLFKIEGLQDGSVLEMVETNYSALTIRLHILRFKDILVSGTKRFAGSSILTKLVAAEPSESFLKAENNSTPTPAPVAQAVQSSASKKKGGKKKNKANKKGKKKNTAVAVRATAAAKATAEKKPSVFDIEEFKLSAFFPEKEVEIRCLSSINFAGWNPPPTNRRWRGDLCYLQVHTLERKSVFITGSTTGFYVNRSTATTFDPLPAEKSYASHTLVGLLQQLSPLFASNFETLVNTHYERHPFEVVSVPYPDMNTPWLHQREDHTFDLAATEEFLTARDVGDLTNRFQDQLRDWNEEYQGFKDFPKATIQDRITRDRAIIRVTTEFVEAAVAGAKLIVNGNIIPINPMDPVPSQLYICDNIFFSHALNGRFLYDEGEGEMGPYKQVNNDLRGVIAYNLFDIPQLHTVLTVLINFRGHRIVAQSIIPGILYQTEVNIIHYGSIDHGETIVWNEDFHNLVKKAAEHLRVPEHSVEDAHGTVAKLYCSSETKGVRGSDGRKYVLDLDRYTVRDVNFSERWAVVRLELYDIYTDYLRHSHRIKYKKEYEELARREAAKKAAEKAAAAEKTAATTTSDSATTTDANDTPVATTSSESGDEKAAVATTGTEDEPEIVIPEFILPQFNPNAFGLQHGKLAGDAEEIKKQEDQIKELSTFLLESVVPTVVKELANGNNVPTDSASLLTVLHSHGVNVRYLGHIAKQLNSTTAPFVFGLCIREMVIRATKHILFAYMRKYNDEPLPSVVHFLNCFVRGAHLQNYCNPNAPADGMIAERYGITPLSLWSEIKEAIQNRYKYELRDEFKAARYMLATLRGLCQQSGIQLIARNYDFYTPQPFTEEDINNFFPTVKSSFIVNVDGHELLEAGKSFLLQGRLDIAFDYISEALAIFHQTYGSMHVFSAHCYTHLALVLYHAGDISAAMAHQERAIIIHERVNGLDYHETAYGYGNLGLFCHQNNQTEQGLMYIKRALYLASLIAGEDHPDNATSYSNIASILQDCKHYSDALEYYLKALKHAELHCAPNHISLAAACHNVAIGYSHLDEFRSALIYERRCYDILNQTFGEKDFRTVEAAIWVKQFSAKATQVEDSGKSAPAITETKSNTRANKPGTVPSVLSDKDDNNISTLPLSDLLRYINNGDSGISRRTRFATNPSSNILRSVNPKR